MRLVCLCSRLCSLSSLYTNCNLMKFVGSVIVLSNLTLKAFILVGACIVVLDTAMLELALGSDHQCKSI
jgi:hypothetical protein